MPIRNVGPDVNGLFYQAVTTAEWSGPYGAQLRIQGYRYCGYGTWGIYIAGPGEPCSTSSPTAPAPPPVQPMILPPAETTGGVGSPPASVNIGCGCHKDAGVVAPPPMAGAPVPVVLSEPGQVKVVERLRGLPWWVYVLAALALSQVFNRGKGG